MATDPAARPASRERGLPAPALIPIAGLVWWVTGFLPWILSGLGHDVLSRLGTPLAAVPLFTGHVSELLVGSGVGGLTAGFVPLLGRGRRASRIAAVAAGVTVTVAIVVMQSRSALGGTDGRVLDGLTALVVLVTVVALAIGLLATAGRAGIGIAGAALAGAAPVWLPAVLSQVGLDGPGAFQHVTDGARWVGAAMLAASLATIGLRRVARLVWWPVAIVLAWIVSPTVTAAAYIEPMLRPGMGLPDMLGEHLSATLDVWRMAASPGVRPLTPWIVAIVAGVVVSLVLDRVRAKDHPVPTEP
ncbi:hypothetical protein [Aeromicrobium wangtongii]|uniref:hypothetical protein n=1 Tax=Aeromicrobium wangtongii TaxID=2969247 RepID=UPI002017CD58|nr:hypothetical protein [Aeromicrobium wangtongii]MCL3818953.1 hypothetical protein [Aeromicrobium wangtongii]